MKSSVDSQDDFHSLNGDQDEEEGVVPDENENL